MVEPMRSVARHSAPDTAAYARAAASASPSATTSGITTISQIRSMSGAESPVHRPTWRAAARVGRRGPTPKEDDPRLIGALVVQRWGRATPRENHTAGRSVL